MKRHQPSAQTRSSFHKVFLQTNKALLITLMFGCMATTSFVSCKDDEEDKGTVGDTEFKQKMRDFVISISQYAKAANPTFNIIPQNGIELVSTNGDNSGAPHTAYLNAIDANGQEDLWYGYDNDDQATPSDVRTYLKELLDISKNAGNTILVTDYCSTTSNIEDSYLQNSNAGYVSFAATQRELNVIPTVPNPIHGENNAVVTSLSQVKNFLYLINPADFPTKTDFINAVKATNYDLLIMDLFFTDGTAFTEAEVAQLKSKANGGKRLVISYMSIGEAENYRYYWQAAWNTTKPPWMDAENPDWPGNFKVKYWDPEWQHIIFGNDQSYLKKILTAGFDGVYLDIIDAFEVYE
ncbi:cysteinyl-tRNA synthetase, unknown class [Chryseolinea serpens]|uniref:Glycoside-hydrolase family GH114 TIM-barrel domain-containing protein n=2 Tax=Chryseolinea serpens TaxID=947013 RepID=A0A1M5P4Q7_9BACT|nr:cysteinyl-tRNA synthetase, unknown class [Chryseolinea serpens]